MSVIISWLNSLKRRGFLLHNNNYVSIFCRHFKLFVLCFGAHCTQPFFTIWPTSGHLQSNLLFKELRWPPPLFGVIMDANLPIRASFRAPSLALTLSSCCLFGTIIHWFSSTFTQTTFPWVIISNCQKYSIWSAKEIFIFITSKVALYKFPFCYSWLDTSWKMKGLQSTQNDLLFILLCLLFPKTLNCCSLDGSLKLLLSELVHVPSKGAFQKQWIIEHKFRGFSSIHTVVDKCDLVSLPDELHSYFSCHALRAIGV